MLCTSAVCQPEVRSSRAEQAAEEIQEDGNAVEDMSPPSLGPTVEELFEEGIGRLNYRETWKLWKWPDAEKVFYTPDDFKCALIHSLQSDVA